MNAIPMDIFQNVDQDWGDKLNAAITIFKEQMQMILEARNDMARCQHIITQQNNQIVHLQVQMQGQGAGLSTAQATTSILSYSKKVEIFNNPGEYDRSKKSLKSGGQKFKHS